MKRRCDGIMDIVLVGETDTQHAQAWHHYRFYGRVHEWNGLIALARIPVDNPRLGARVFLGYVVGGQTLVGNWRIMAINTSPSFSNSRLIRHLPWVPVPAILMPVLTPCPTQQCMTHEPPP